MIIIRNVVLTIMGIFIYLISSLYPIFRLVFFDWIGIGIMMVPWILDVYGMHLEQTLLQTDKTRKWETIVEFIDRNRDVHSILTHKPYHTQSFLEAKGFGLIENKGKDSVLKKGTKKYVLAVENCEHTTDPNMMVASEILYEDMGIRDTNTLKKLLTGKYLNAGDYKVMGLSMVAMMMYNQNHGGKKLVNEWEQYDGPNKSFEPMEHTPTGFISDKVDFILKRKEEGMDD